MSGRKVAYAQGFVDGLRKSGWDCPDCGNWYEASVEECPNREMDEATTTLRHEKWKADNA